MTAIGIGLVTPLQPPNYAGIGGNQEGVIDSAVLSP